MLERTKNELSGVAAPCGVYCVCCDPSVFETVRQGGIGKVGILRHYFLTITFAIVACSLCCGSVLAQQAGSAVVTVKVTNSTATGKDVAGDAVSLRVFHQGKESKSVEGTVGPDGKAVFEDVPVGEGFVGIAQARHSGMSFGSGPFELKAGGGRLECEIDVYEVLADNSKLSIGASHFVVKLSGDSIIVTEYVQIKNPTDMAMTSANQDDEGRNKVIEISLPEGYRDLTMLNYFQESAIVQTKEGFYDIMASPPGEHQTAFSYSLDIESDVVEITKKMSMPTAEFMVFSQLPVGKVKGLGKPSGNMTLADGKSAEYFTISSLKRGQEVKFQLDCTPQVFEVSTDNSRLSAGLHRFVVRASGNSIMITEYVQVKNPTDMVITSPEKDEQGRHKVIEMFLPEGFKDLTMLHYFEDDSVTITDEGFYSFAEITPGDYQAAFSYALDIASATVEVTKNVSMPTEQFIVYSQLGAGNLHGLEVEPEEMKFADGSPAEFFRLPSQEKGAELKFELTGFTVGRSQKQTVIILSVVFGVMGLLAVKRALLKKA